MKHLFLAIGYIQEGEQVSVTVKKNSVTQDDLGDPSNSSTFTITTPSANQVFGTKTVTVEIGYSDLCSLPSDFVGRVFFNFANYCQFNASGDNAHWSVGDSHGRWYVDSRNTSDYTEDTIHKIWVGCNE